MHRRHTATRRRLARRHHMPTACFVSAVRIGAARSAAAEMRPAGSVGHPATGPDSLPAD